MEKTQSKVLKVVKISTLTIFYIIIGFLLLFSIATLSVKSTKDIPNLFGTGFLAVNKEADSMVGDNIDSFDPGDLVFVKVLSEKQRKNLDLQQMLDDKIVISFYDPSIKAINTHRIIEYHKDPLDSSKDTVRTKGDNAEADNYYWTRDEILATYKGKANGLGKPIAFMQTPLGFGLVVVLPTLALLIYQGIVLMRNLYVVKEQKLRESIADNNKLEREKIRKELLEEMRKEKEESED